MPELPRWKCHKDVNAAKIVRVVPRPDLQRSRDFNALELWLADCPSIVVVDAAWHARHRPSEGGYYVVYSDGYTSFSPAKVFEEGYTLFGTKTEASTLADDILGCPHNDTWNCPTCLHKAETLAALVLAAEGTL